MITGLYSVYDRAAGTFAPPVSFAARGLAIRWFYDLCSQQLAKHKNDYELYVVASWDDDNATCIQPQDAVERIAYGGDVLTEEG